MFLLGNFLCNNSNGYLQADLDIIVRFPCKNVINAVI